jgi:tetratricopeptide (TPR) repeat protein
VYFAKGDLAKAERYVDAAWKLTQRAEIGDHLGQIYEKTGRRDKAIRAYAEALVAEQPDKIVREHLAGLAGGPEKVDAIVTAHREDLFRARTIDLPVKGPASKKADFFVLVSSAGHVEGLKFVEGDEQMRALAPALQRLTADGWFPDDTPSKMLRRGIAACGSTGTCTFTMLLPTDARPAK